MNQWLKWMGKKQNILVQVKAFRASHQEAESEYFLIPKLIMQRLQQVKSLSENQRFVLRALQINNGGSPLRPAERFH